MTAIAWSTRCTSPSSTDEWSIECVRILYCYNRVTNDSPIRLTAAGAHFDLYHLTKTHNSSEVVFRFGGGLSGHHGKVNDMAYCGGQSEDSWRYVATVSGRCSTHVTIHTLTITRRQTTKRSWSGTSTLPSSTPATAKVSRVISLKNSSLCNERSQLLTSSTSPTLSPPYARTPLQAESL